MGYRVGGWGVGEAPLLWHAHMSLESKVAREREGYWVGFNKLKINYGQLTRVYCRRNVGGQGDHRCNNPYKGNKERNINGIAIIYTFGAVKRTTYKIFLAFPPHRLRNGCRPHCHHRSGRAGKVEALFLADPNHRATIRTRSRILRHCNCSHCHQ